ncbi:hypothetical protein GCM10027436_16390 [Actinophytocola sediminis]
MTSGLLDDAVRAGENEGLATVGEADEVGRSALVASDFDDLAQLVRVSDMATVDMESVAYLGLHRTTSVRPG